MADARKAEQWNHTSHLLAWIENNAFGRDGKPVRARDRNPMAPKAPKRKMTIKDLDEMAGL